MNYSLRPISNETVKNINENWFEQLASLDGDHSYFASGIEHLVAWCEKTLAAGETHLWEICDKETNELLAIVEVVDAERSRDPSFKLLKIYLQPNLMMDLKEEVRQEDVKAVTDIFTYAMGGSLAIATSNGTKKLKVFGRTSEMINLFDSLLLAETPGYNLCRQGRWLVIESLGD